MTGKAGAYNVAILKTTPDLLQINNKFFYYYLKSNHFQNPLLNKTAKRAAQDGFSKDDIGDFPVPLPTLNEQIRIVTKLDSLFERIDKAITLVEQNIANAQHLMASVLNDVFEGLKNECEMKPLMEVARVGRGKSKHRPRNDKKLFGGKYPFIQTGNVRNAKKFITDFEQTYNEIGLAQSKIWNAGTLCLTIAANIGDVAILGIDACFPDSVVGITSETIEIEFLYYYLKTKQLELDNKANAAAQKNIGLKTLEELYVPIPSREIQKRVVAYLSEISGVQEDMIIKQEKRLRDLTKMKSSLLDMAFKGEL